MKKEITSAADIAKQRLIDFLENLNLLTAFNDIALWGLFTFLLEKAKQYNPGSFNISPGAYQKDRDKAEAVSQRKTDLRKHEEIERHKADLAERGNSRKI